MMMMVLKWRIVAKSMAGEYDNVNRLRHLLPPGPCCPQ
jgi:hypothetical protein